MVAVKFIVWLLVNLFFVLFVAIPGTLLVFILAPIYFSWGVVTQAIPEGMNRVEKWVD